MPYYLIGTKEEQRQMVRDDAAPDLAVPMWVIKSGEQRSSAAAPACCGVLVLSIPGR